MPASLHRPQCLPTASQLLVIVAVTAIAVELAGVELPSVLLALAMTVVLLHTLKSSMHAPLWRRFGLWSLAWALIYAASFFYVTRELPYRDQPFAAVAFNPVTPLDIRQLPELQISGLPTIVNSKTVATSSVPATAPVVSSHSQTDGHGIVWSQLSSLMDHDSELRDILVALQSQQAKALSEERARLNSLSVADTGMRRRGLNTSTIEELYQAHAISTAKYRTVRETWQLLDADEERFKEQQADELFHTLIGALENERINESEKVRLINFLVTHYGKDARLVQPMIRIYERLDSEYPRQKRFNRDFLDLYIAKREALLHGFASIGPPAKQALLDYRRKFISRISYSQARLDVFLKQTFDDAVRLPYGISTPRSVPALLNRLKYPAFSRTSGASYEYDYERKNLTQLAVVDTAPAFGQIFPGMRPEAAQAIREAAQSGYTLALDTLAIDPDPAVRATLALSLAEVKRAELLPLALDLMKDPNPDVRRVAAIGIGNYRLLDAQGANDQKFVEIVRLLQNYRSNSDTFSRGWAVLALTDSGDKEKALYLIDLLLNDGQSSSSLLGASSPAWRSEEEHQAISGLIGMLRENPENEYVKTQALNALVALDSPEALGVLLHYLRRTYALQHSQPSLWRTVLPHMTLPQSAENVEDVVLYLAQRHGAGNPHYHQRELEALQLHLQHVYEDRRSGEYFQFLRFLYAFDQQAYGVYLEQNFEHVRLLRGLEFLRATALPALVLWLPMILLLTAVHRFLTSHAAWRPQTPASTAKRRANPAAAAEKPRPPPAILPISVARRA